MFQAYLIGMVWSCYKYIQLRVASRSVLRQYTIDPDSQVNTLVLVIDLQEYSF